MAAADAGRGDHGHRDAGDERHRGASARCAAPHPRLPVVMFSTLTERGAAATLDALAAGASDYVTKPSNVGSVAESPAATSASS